MKKIALLIFILNYLYSYDTNDINVKSVIKDDMVYVYFQNNSFFDVTFQFKSEYKNMKILYKSDFDTSASKTKILVAKFKILNNNYDLKNKYSWSIGNKHSIHDNSYIYSLPYNNKNSFNVSQGNNGLFTHKNESQYAIDFDMPIGTKIYSMREGLVVATEDKFNNNGGGKKLIKKANFITIKHSDGTYATYNHLKHKGLMVKEGDYVFKKQFIGYSGNSGYSTNPHLHVVVFKGLKLHSRQSIQIKLNTLNDGIVKNIKTDKIYKSTF